MKFGHLIVRCLYAIRQVSLLLSRSPEFAGKDGDREIWWQHSQITCSSIPPLCGGPVCLQLKVVFRPLFASLPSPAGNHPLTSESGPCSLSHGLWSLLMKTALCDRQDYVFTSLFKLDTHVCPDLLISLCRISLCQILWNSFQAFLRYNADKNGTYIRPQWPWPLTIKFRYREEIPSTCSWYRAHKNGTDVR